MATMQELLGTDYKDGMTIDDINKAIANKNIADLSSGNYVAKGKYEAESLKAKQIQDEYLAFKTANMTEEQKRTEQAKVEAEQRELISKRLSTYELKDKLLDKGFSKDEVNKIIENNQSPDVYAEIMTARIEMAKLSAQGQFIKTNTTMPDGATQGNELSQVDTLKLQLQKANESHDMANIAKYTRLLAEENAKQKK